MRLLQSGDGEATRTGAALLHDAVWQRPVLTQPTAIRTVASFARRIGAVKFFDAGDVQTNGFQLVEDDIPFQTFTETGASYTGFAAPALLGVAGIARPKYGIAFTGDGSFMMNPQILIDAVEHGVLGMIALFDNRRDREGGSAGIQDYLETKDVKMKLAPRPL